MLEVGLVVADQMPPAGPHARVLVREDVTLTHQAVSALIEQGLAEEGHPLAGWRAHRRVCRNIALGDTGPWLVAHPGATPIRRRGLRRPSRSSSTRRASSRVRGPTHPVGVDVLELPQATRWCCPPAIVQLLWATCLACLRFSGGPSQVATWCRSPGTWDRDHRFSIPGPRVVSGRLVRKGRNCASIRPQWSRDAGSVTWTSVPTPWSGECAGRRCGGGGTRDGRRLRLRARSTGAAPRDGEVRGTCERAVCGGIAQPVLDQDAALKLTATLMDQGLGQGVRVQAAGELRRAPIGPLGVHRRRLRRGRRRAGGPWALPAAGRRDPPACRAS